MMVNSRASVEACFTWERDELDYRDEGRCKEAMGMVMQRETSDNGNCPLFET